MCLVSSTFPIRAAHTPLVHVYACMRLVRNNVIVKQDVNLKEGYFGAFPPQGLAEVRYKIAAVGS